MSNRLDQDREKRLQPERMKTAISKIEALGYDVSQKGETLITFDHDSCTINYYPYSGWASGQSIKDGRGLNNLLKQLNNQK